MSATERLRELLDERGVEWWEGDDERKTHWCSNGLTWEYLNDENGDAWLGFLGACESDITPEQAIAATLGQEDIYTREDVESAFVSGYSLGSLPVGSDPQWDENRQTVDEHMAELGWMRISDAEGASTDTDGHDSGHVRNVSATLGSGTCVNMDGEAEAEWFTCSECNTELRVHEPFDAFSIHFCPNCGRRCVG